MSYAHCSGFTAGTFTTVHSFSSTQMFLDKPAPCLTQTMDKEVKNAFFQELLDRQINRNNKDTTS